VRERERDRARDLFGFNKKRRKEKKDLKINKKREKIVALVFQTITSWLSSITH